MATSRCHRQRKRSTRRSQRFHRGSCLECDRCGKERLFNEAYISEAQRRTRLGVFLARARHEGCGGRVVRAELLTGTEAASRGPVRRIVLRG
jgi:hypothetical protein